MNTKILGETRVPIFQELAKVVDKFPRVAKNFQQWQLCATLENFQKLLETWKFSITLEDGQKL